MLKFSEFIQKNKVPESILSWDGSFSNPSNKTKENILSWKSDNADNRSNMKENLHEGRILPPSTKNFLEETGRTIRVENPNPIDPTDDSQKMKVYDQIHDHPAIKPSNITTEHQEAIERYSNTPSKHPTGHGSSHNLNAYLRNRADPDEFTQIENHSENDVKESVRRLSSAFTPENTNRAAIRTYTGIPPSIGLKFLNSRIGSKHTLAGFTSSSTSFDTAQEFAFNHALDDGEMEPHIMISHVEPGAGLSVVHHSPHREDEILLHHGAHITYRGSEQEDDGDGNINHYHHVTVHPTHKSLEDYGPYKVKK